VNRLSRTIVSVARSEVRPTSARSRDEGRVGTTASTATFPSAGVSVILWIAERGARPPEPQVEIHGLARFE
jgi:hypothetical protein